MKKIVVFGATGMVGAYTVIDLRAYGYDVIAVGRRKSDNGFFAKMQVPYFSVDITQKKEFEKLPLVDIDAVVHLAGAMPASMQGYYPHEYVYSVLDGTLNVLEYCRKVNAARIVFAQSRADSNYLMGSKKPIPADIVKKFPLTGDHAVYSICKNAAVDLIEHFYYEYGLKRFVLRFPTIYGYHPNPYFYVNGKKRVMAYRLLIDKALKGEDIEVWGDPTKAKEIVYVKDTTQIIRKAISVDIDGGMYNVGRGVGVTLQEQIEGIVEVFSSDSQKSKLIYRPDMPNAREFVHDISKTQKELGFVPQYDYIELLKDFKCNMETEPMKLLWGTRENY